jgi:phospholipid transport system transporter-binding protein
LSGCTSRNAAFELLGADRARITGCLGFRTVSALLPAGSEAIVAGRAASIDLGAIESSDSSGLALLIEWLSVAKHAGRTLRYENVPTQLHQLARLSEVDALLSAASNPGN